VVDLDALVRGTRDRPIVTGQLTVANGRVRRFSYERLSSRVEFADNMFRVAARLDQGPGTWMTANGDVPLALFDRALPERAIDVAIVSSPIDLGLIEGLTNVVRNVGGELRLDVRAIGTSADPHFRGCIDVANAG